MFGTRVFNSKFQALYVWVHGDGDIWFTVHSCRSPQDECIVINPNPKTSSHFKPGDVPIRTSMKFDPLSKTRISFVELSAHASVLLWYTLLEFWLINYSTFQPTEILLVLVNGTFLGQINIVTVGECCRLLVFSYSIDK